MTLMEDIEEMLQRARITRVIDAINGAGCIIVNPNYNPVRGLENGLILRSADKEWLIGTITQILRHSEQEKGNNDSE